MVTGLSQTQKAQTDYHTFLTYGLQKFFKERSEREKLYPCSWLSHLSLGFIIFNEMY